VHGFLQEGLTEGNLDLSNDEISQVQFWYDSWQVNSNEWTLQNSMGDFEQWRFDSQNGLLLDYFVPNDLH
jgi:hypothetical protein